MTDLLAEEAAAWLARVKTPMLPNAKAADRAWGDSLDVIIRCEFCDDAVIFEGSAADGREAALAHRLEKHPEAGGSGTKTTARGATNGGGTAREALDRMDAGEPQQPSGPIQEENRNGSGALPNAKHTLESIIAAIRDYAADHDGYAPPSNLPPWGAMSLAARRRFGLTWRQVIDQAQVKPALQGRAAEKAKKSEARWHPPTDVEPLDAAAGTEPPDSRASKPPVLRDPIRTADIPYDADILESEAAYLHARAEALLEIAGGVRKLHALSQPNGA